MNSFDTTNKIWYGPKVDRSEYNAMTLRESLIKSFRKTPEKVFQISDDEGTKLIYKETEILSIRIANNFTKFGVKKDDVVAILMPNSTYLAPIAFGCILNGIALAPFLFLKSIDSEGLKTSLKITKPKAIILEDFVDDVEMIAQVTVDMNLVCKIFTFGTDKKFCNLNIFPFCELLTQNDKEKNFKLSFNDDITDETTTFIIPSSGTTGTPKAIAFDGHYFKLAKNYWLEPNNRDNPVTYSYVPFGGISCVCNIFFTILNNGLRIISKEKFTLTHFSQLVKTYGITLTTSTVENCAKLMKSPDFESLKEFFCCGERVQFSVREFLKSSLKPGVFGVGYGITEAGLIARLNPNADTSGVKDNIAGMLTENFMGKIIDIKTGKQLGPNEVGEIYVKTGRMFKCYYGNPDLTSKALDADGFFKTGDVGYFDNEGALHIYGRVNDLINTQGELIHPAHIENAFESIDGVKCACIVEIVQGEVLALLVTILPSTNITEEDLKKFSDENFPKIKFLGGFYIIDEFPRSVFTKILRREAKKLAVKLMNLKKLQVLAKNINAFGSAGK